MMGFAFLPFAFPGFEHTRQTDWRPPSGGMVGEGVCRVSGQRGLCLRVPLEGPPAAVKVPGSKTMRYAISARPRALAQAG